VFLHGGGWVWGSLDSHDSVARSFAVESGCAVLSVGYRLAPEAPYPAALDDVAATLDWIPGAAREFGLDDTHIAMCGDSSGANLAIVTALNSPAKLRHLGLVYPPLDPTCSTPSQDLYAKDHLLTQEGMLWFWDLYQQGATAPRVLDADLSGLPPVSIALAECDVLHDEGAALHARLQKAGVPSRLRVYEGMIHAFISLPHITPVANVAISEMARDIAASLQQEPAE
jgi:acetyl esterase/lipase